MTMHSLHEPCRSCMETVATDERRRRMHHDAELQAQGIPINSEVKGEVEQPISRTLGHEWDIIGRSATGEPSYVCSCSSNEPTRTLFNRDDIKAHILDQVFKAARGTRIG